MEKELVALIYGIFRIGMKYSLVKLNSALSNSLSKFAVNIVKGVLDINEKSEEP